MGDPQQMLAVGRDAVVGLGVGESDELLLVVVEAGLGIATGGRGGGAKRSEAGRETGSADAGGPESAAAGDRVLRAVAGLLSL